MLARFRPIGSHTGLVQYGKYLLLVIPAFIVLSCRDGGVAASHVQPGEATRGIDDAVMVAATIPPPQIFTVATPNKPSFVLPDAGDQLTPVADEPEIIAANTKVPASATPPASAPTDTATAGPTYTPPPAPSPAAWEHLWFARPVSLDTAPWTDKAYPYGSTRGGTLRPHHGVEFNVPAGTPIYAAASGTIVLAGSDENITVGELPDFYGNVVVIKHDFLSEGLSVYTLYGHLSEIRVEEGQQVKAQELIGLSGSSGVADGAHLHFEVRLGQNDYQSTRNPILWLYPFPDRGVVAGNVTWPDGSAAVEVPLQLRRLDAASQYASTTTYAAEGVNSDNVIKENFAFDDVEAGYYELLAGTGENRVGTKFWVYPYQTSLVELQLDG